MKVRHPAKFIFVGLLVLIIVLSVVWKVRSSNASKLPVETAVVKRGTVVSTVSASGVLQPLTTVDLKSNAGGRVDVLAVDVGSVVKAGQLIAKIDPSDSRTALNQAEADLSAAQARLSQSKETLALQREQYIAELRQAEKAYAAAKARLTQAEAQAGVQPALTKSAIQQAEANLNSAEEALRQLKAAGVPQGMAQAKATYDQAKATLDRTRRNFERQQSLYEKGFISANDFESAKLEYDTAKAQFDSANERMQTVQEEYKAQVRAAEARVNQACAAFESAKANAVQDELRRAEVLAARADMEKAAAGLSVAKSNARQVPIKAADIRASEAQVVRAKAEVENARTQLDYTIITAPRDGIVLKKYVEVGTIITSGRSSFAGTGQGTSIVQLGDCSKMFVLASVDETDIAQVKVNMRVNISLDAYPGEVFKGRVTKIDPETVVEQNVTTIPVTVEILNPDARLKPGMNATCDFVVDVRRNVLMIPSVGVKERDGHYTVTMLQNGQQVEREIRIGIAGDEYTEVVSGLKEGDVIVTSAGEFTPAQSTGGPPPMGFGPPMGGPRGMR